MKLTEAQVQKHILQLLSAYGIFHWRNNTGAVKSTYKGKDRFVRFGEPGMPDIWVLRPARTGNSRLIGVEVKSPTGRQSAAQQDFQKRLEAAGGIYLLVHSPEEFHLKWGEAGL